MKTLTFVWLLSAIYWAATNMELAPASMNLRSTLLALSVVLSFSENVSSNGESGFVGAAGLAM